MTVATASTELFTDCLTPSHQTTITKLQLLKKKDVTSSQHHLKLYIILTLDEFFQQNVTPILAKRVLCTLSWSICSKVYIVQTPLVVVHSQLVTLCQSKGFHECHLISLINQVSAICKPLFEKSWKSNITLMTTNIKDKLA